MNDHAALIRNVREKREAAKQIIGKPGARHYATPKITLADIDALLAAVDALSIERDRYREALEIIESVTQSEYSSRTDVNSLALRALEDETA